MLAKYATRCSACPVRIAPGEEIVRSADGQSWAHAACPGGDGSGAGTPVEAGTARTRQKATRKATRKASQKTSQKTSKPLVGSADDPVPAGTTVVFTDGACRGNPGPGGWAWAVQDGPQDSGHDPATTNQRMEVRAAYEAIRSLEGPLVVVSDSTYVVNCFENGWWVGWRSRGWTNTAKKPVANRDLWEPLVDLVEERGEVSFRWVKGHSGHPMNDLVDELAVAASHRAG